jgi:hypothetical protein
MMDQLYDMVAQKAGINADQAKTAVDTVVGFVKQQLPEPMAAQFDALLGVAGGSGNVDMSQIGDMLSGLGSMLGGDKK